MAVERLIIQNLRLRARRNKMTQEINLTMSLSTTGQMKKVLENYRDQFTSMLPSTAGIGVDKIMSTAIEAAGGNSAVLQCSGLSVVSAVKQACEFGLTFSRAFGQAYLVPFKGKCELIIGYRGLLDLARRATGGEVTMDSEVVYSSDEFSVEKGTATKIYHKINHTAPRKDEDIIGAYFVATYPDGRQMVEWMSRDEINLIRARSKSATSGKPSPWSTDLPAMCRKTVIKRGIKYLPMSSEKARLLEKAIEHDIITDGIADEPTVSSKEKAAAIAAELSEEPTSEPMPNDKEDLRI